MPTDDPIVEFRNVYKTYDGETLVIKDLTSRSGAASS
jgi:hypothetical protein